MKKHPMNTSKTRCSWVCANWAGTIRMQTVLTIGILATLLFFAACTRTERAQSDPSADAIVNQPAAEALSSLNAVPAPSTDLFWDYRYDTISNESIPIQVRPVDPDTLTENDIEALINRAWPEVPIRWVTTSADTAFIEILDSHILTQQMGSAGATQFLVVVTYSFTEIPGIRFVSFAFEEGDHAVPGIYHRGSWDHHQVIRP